MKHGGNGWMGLSNFYYRFDDQNEEYIMKWTLYPPRRNGCADPLRAKTIAEIARNYIGVTPGYFSYPYEVEGKSRTANSFEEVLFAAYENPFTFSIPKRYANRYSSQELAIVLAFCHELIDALEEGKVGYANAG